MSCKSQRISLLEGFGAVRRWSSGLSIKWKYTTEINKRQIERSQSSLNYLVWQDQDKNIESFLEKLGNDTLAWNVMVYSDVSRPRNCEGFLSLMKVRCPVWKTHLWKTIHSHSVLQTFLEVSVLIGLSVYAHK